MDDTQTLYLCQVHSRDLHAQPGWEQRAASDLGPRAQALSNALTALVDDWAREEILAELEQADGDVRYRREFPGYGSIELLAVQAAGRLAGRYLAVNHLETLEREVYVEALLQDAIADGLAAPTDLQHTPDGLLVDGQLELALAV